MQGFSFYLLSGCNRFQCALWISVQVYWYPPLLLSKNQCLYLHSCKYCIFHYLFSINVSAPVNDWHTLSICMVFQCIGLALVKSIFPKNSINPPTAFLSVLNKESLILIICISPFVLTFPYLVQNSIYTPYILLNCLFPCSFQVHGVNGQVGSSIGW